MGMPQFDRHKDAQEESYAVRWRRKRQEKRESRDGSSKYDSAREMLAHPNRFGGIMAVLEFLSNLNKKGG